MLIDFIKKMWRVAFMALVVFGAVMLARDVWRWAGKKEAAPLPMVAPITAPVVASCECSTGATCTGQRGGMYCLTASGNKKYTEKQQ